MLVVSDTDDVFAPASPDTLVPPVGARLEAWEVFLEVSNTHRLTGSPTDRGPPWAD